MRHHERIKSLISLRVDGSVIGLDNSGTTAICVPKKKRETMCWCDNVGARCRQRGCELKSASVFIRKSIRFKQFSPTGKMREYKMQVLKKQLLSLLKGQFTLKSEIYCFPVMLFIHIDHFGVAEF